MLYQGRFRIYHEAAEEFEWIKNTYMTKDNRLNELVDLRNYLKENVRRGHAAYDKVTTLINEIDCYWWDLFTQGNGGQVKQWRKDLYSK